MKNEVVHDLMIYQINDGEITIKGGVELKES